MYIEFTFRTVLLLNSYNILGVSIEHMSHILHLFKNTLMPLVSE